MLPARIDEEQVDVFLEESLSEKLPGGGFCGGERPATISDMAAP
jgi:hypothetical protein